MESLEYQVLIEAYERAIELGLEEDFIALLREEISERTTDHNVTKKSKLFL
ncbi:sporulation histidine kinase inhibitor Sda [Alkalihalobacillus sp. MEB130]|uniref:sporulation histidine kinase inhibitor Sda n=1 Tax=Alkalihalobacillus sp. MEB130 TaxID=2976704 RepID=UPI0028DDD97E|nr:sporulation histidine kinase inhibitor Sda [Alkalihalobacillus sp. MEB130]MDT8862992.1 sporulation histidine kinase inhibitor Sda [Alkalihalobacillus sp. MEB130]